MKHVFTIGAWFALAALSVLTACGGPWKMAPERLSTPRWTISPPEQWMYLRTSNGDMFSKDGAYLEYILVQTRPLGQRYRFTQQKLSADMLPHEAARLITANLRSDPLISQFRLLADEPAMVDGHPGFRLEYSYLDQNKVELKTIHYGVILSDLYFNMRYTAARRHYFDKELPAFIKTFQSLRLASR